MFDCDTTKLR